MAFWKKNKKQEPKDTRPMIEQTGYASCRECKWHGVGLFTDTVYCNHPNSHYTSYAEVHLGKAPQRCRTEARDMRMPLTDRHCGISAKYYEPIEPGQKGPPQ